MLESFSLPACYPVAFRLADATVPCNLFRRRQTPNSFCPSLFLKCGSQSLATKSNRRQCSSLNPQQEDAEIANIQNQSKICVIGIDPDTQGALAYIVLNSGGTFEKSSEDCVIMDVPVCEFLTGSKPKKRRRMQVDPVGTAALLKEVQSKGFSSIRAYVERPAPLPMNGNFSNFISGIGYGVWRGALSAIGIPTEVVFVGRWKRDLDLFRQPKDKSRELARQLFPSSEDFLTRKKDHGRAEALLIAWWGVKQLSDFQSEHAQKLDRANDLESTDLEVSSESELDDGPEKNLNYADYSAACLESKAANSEKEMSSINVPGSKDLISPHNKSEPSCDADSSIPRNPKFVVDERFFESCEEVLDAGLALNKKQVMYRINSPISKWKNWKSLGN